MAKIDNNNPESQPENGADDFATLFEAYAERLGGQLQVGDKISGEIIAIGKESVFVDTGTKIDGVVDSKELKDENGRMTCNPGDKIELFVVAVDEGEIRLSKAVSGVGDQRLLEDAFRNGIPVEGKVTEVCKGGFRVDVMKRKAFCPISQMDLRFVETPENYLGETYAFIIIQYEAKGRNIVLSRRNLLEREQQKIQAEFLATLESGAILAGTVTRLMPFGAFVELIPGLEGMVHISELSWSRIEAPESAVRVGEKVQVKVLAIDAANGSGRPKISLSAKQVSDDPWTSVDIQFHQGDLVTGKVTRCAPFGAFVEIAPGIEGLVHISEMSFTKRINKPEECVGPGAEVAVTIKAIDTQKRRISLSIRDAAGDPWQAVPDKYPVGRSVVGVLEKKEKFGYFVTLEPGITGLLPKSKLGRAADPAAIERLKPGDAITVAVEALDRTSRKITLAPGDPESAGEWRKYESTQSTAVNPLAEKLKAALEAQSKK